MTIMKRHANIWGYVWQLQGTLNLHQMEFTINH